MAENAARFAEELRRRCASYGSIAQVCAATGINRQQFNKYLAGQMLPNARNMQKICVLFGASFQELMQGPAGGPVQAAEAVSSTAADISHQPKAIVQALERAANILPLGHYDCYFPLHAESEMVVRWLLTLRMKQGALTFTCRANVRSMDSPRSISSLTKYNGLVFAGPREAQLVATSSVHLHQPSVISVNSLPVVGRTYYSGLALTRRIDGPLAITAALRYRGHTIKVRKALDAVGIVSLADPDLDPVIVQLMRATPAAGANWMQSVNGKSLRTVSPSEGPVVLPRLAGRRAG